MGNHLNFINIVAVAHVDTTCQIPHVLSKLVEANQTGNKSETWREEIRDKTTTGIRIGKGDMMTIAGC